MVSCSHPKPGSVIKMDQEIINGNRKALLAAQQGEVDAVLMYNRLAAVVPEADAAVFR